MVNPIYEPSPFEQHPKANRSFRRRLEVFDLILALVVFFVAVLLLTGCQPAALSTTPTISPEPTLQPVSASATPHAREASTPWLRIINNRETAIHQLVVIFPEDRIAFGDIAPNATTDYLPVPHGVYRYAAYQVEIDGKVVTQPVIDWVGESPVQGKDFTWVIDVEPNRQQMNIVQLVQATVDR